MSYFLLWPLGISLWLFLGWAFFALFEARGIKHNNTGGYVTLSYFVWRVTSAWPPSIFLLGLSLGLFWGGLAVHFWWHWCPAGSVSIGALLAPLGG
jgi:hypothetical protein